MRLYGIWVRLIKITSLLSFYLLASLFLDSYRLILFLCLLFILLYFLNTLSILNQFKSFFLIRKLAVVWYILLRAKIADSSMGSSLMEFHGIRIEVITFPPLILGEFCLNWKMFLTGRVLLQGMCAAPREWQQDLRFAKLISMAEVLRCLVSDF